MFKKVSEMVDGLLTWLTRVLHEPRNELTRFQQTVRFGYDLTRHGGRQLRQDRAPQMAAALAYRTLFGLLPVLVVGTVVARALMGPETFVDLADRLVESLRLDEVGMNAGTVGEGESSGAADTTTTLGQWVQDLVTKAMGINLAAIGWIGLIVLVYSAIGLIVTVENSFNRVCRAPEGRSWMMRILLYWFMLTVSPLAIGLTFWFDNRVDGWIEHVGAWDWLFTVLNVLWSFIVVWLLMIVVYTLVPNTPVSLRPSMIGAFVAALLLSGLTRLFGVYLEYAVSFTQLYGSLGLIPLFMFWVYVMWLAVLFGLEVASTLHTVKGRRLEELQQREQRNGLVDPAAVLAVMDFAAQRFRNGRPFTLDALAMELSIKTDIVSRIVERLTREGLLLAVTHPEQTFTLSQPPDSIKASQVLALGYELVDEDSSERLQNVIVKLRDAQMRAVEGLTIALLTPHRPDHSAPTAPSTPA